MRKDAQREQWNAPLERETVQLKKFRHHAINTQHSIMIPNWMAFKIPSDERDIEKHKWIMGAVSAFNLSFHLN